MLRTAASRPLHLCGRYNHAGIGDGRRNIIALHRRQQQLNNFSAHASSPRLAGKVTVITGAASGIGKATAAEFIRHGATVIIADINSDLGRATAAELGPTAAFLPCDVTREADVAAAVDHAVSRHGRLDIYFSNAGVTGSLPVPPTLAGLDMADFDRTMAVNLRGTVAGMKHAARAMVPQGSGCILCTASSTGVVAGMAPLAYSVSKSAVVAAVRSAAADLCRHGVRVNCLSPHAVATPMGVRSMTDLAPGIDEGVAARVLEGMWELAGAKCGAVDIAMAAVFLASDEAKYISGHNLVIDGGFTVSKRISISLPSQDQIIY